MLLLFSKLRLNNINTNVRRNMLVHFKSSSLRYLILLLICCSFRQLAMSQVVKTKSLELSINVRHELHEHSITQYGTFPYLTDLKLAGTSLGADFGYKMQFNKGWYIIPSIGYYKFTIDDIENKSIPPLPWAGTRNSRFIDYRPDSTSLGYSTQKYNYNNLSLGLALGKEFSLNSKYQITTDILYNHLISYSQKYYIGNVTYSSQENYSFGMLATGRLGVKRTFKKLYVGTSLLFPIYKQFRKDKILYDDPNERVYKWFGGYGLSFRFGKYLK